MRYRAPLASEIQGLLVKYNSWCVIDMPRISYREYQRIRKPLVAKLAELAARGVVFAVPAISQSLHFMEALMRLNAKFIVVLPRQVSNENRYMRAKLKKVKEYDQAFMVKHESRKQYIRNQAQGVLSSQYSSSRARSWAQSALDDLDRADYIDGLKQREFVMRHILNNARESLFISIYRDEPEYMAADMLNKIPTWKIDLRAKRKVV